MKIWLDDLRPVPDGFIWVHNLAELKALLASNQEVIEVMSFDNDLGDGEPEGYDIIKWLANTHLERWPKEIRVHSANPAGAHNIQQYIDFIRRRILP